MYAFIAAMAIAAAAQAPGNAPPDDRYPSQPATTPPAAPDGGAAGPGLAGQITITGESPEPTLSEAAQPPTPANESPTTGQSAVTPTAPGQTAQGAPSAAASPSSNAAAAQLPVAPNLPKTSVLMREWSRPPRTGQLPGIPMSLAEALRGAETRQQQTDRTMGYWDLAAKVTQYYLVRRDAMELAVLRQGVTKPGPQWEVKALALQNAQDLAQQSAEAAQARLQQLCGRTTATSPPLPADLPHCGKYETRYDEIFANRADAAAKQLDALLPLKYAELRNQAGLVAEASNWLEQVSKSRDPNSDGVGLLRAHELLSLRRRSLVDAVHDYNQDIAIYTELAAPNEVGTERLVAMLIRVSNSGTSGREPTGVQPASGTQDAADADRASQAAFDGPEANPASPQPTYRSRHRTVRRPAFWRLRNREHSILVDRLRGRRLLRD
jgi:hypothetical protein